ncbi:hypothetical protein ACIO7M_31550 [Streptomyces toxytricini]|uniref:Uncharacterized protein n=1 Tax=Streptomyces toxytricini TaxID=67369 RepID=A0ABW8EQR5_STRT5
MRFWTEQPAKAEVEAVVRCYVGLLQAGKFPQAEHLIDHGPTRHVLTSLWAGSVEAGAAEGREASTSPAADVWEQDPSWLGEIALADFHWGDTGSHVYVEITYRGQTIEVALSFWLKPVDAGWVIAGPGTLW